jgi:hypothetical protein
LSELAVELAEWGLQLAELAEAATRQRAAVGGTSTLEVGRAELSRRDAEANLRDARSNLELTRALGTVLRRPTLFPIPTFAIRLLYGEMGATLATVSQRVLPTRLLAEGFTFRHTTILAALRTAFDRQGAV